MYSGVSSVDRIAAIRSITPAGCDFRAWNAPAKNSLPYKFTCVRGTERLSAAASYHMLKVSRNLNRKIPFPRIKMKIGPWALELITGAI